MRKRLIFASMGFTLTEFLVVIALLGILISIAIPGFSELIVRNRLATSTNDFISALNLARSEAIKRGQIVVVRKTGQTWEQGWRVFVDIDRSTNAKTNNFNIGKDLELRVFSALTDTYTLRGNNNFINFISYQPSGRSNNIGSFALCADQDVTRSKLIVINTTGRIRIAPDDNRNGVPEKDGGADIESCLDGF